MVPPSCSFLPPALLGCSAGGGSKRSPPTFPAATKGHQDAQTGNDERWAAHGTSRSARPGRGRASEEKVFEEMIPEKKNNHNLFRHLGLWGYKAIGLEGYGATGYRATGPWGYRAIGL
eukprot:2382661-Pyramimonas_sp.AAC.1